MNEEFDIEELAPWLVIFITLVGYGLRVLLLDQKGMWLDETFSVWLAKHSVADMLAWTVKIDQHPPLYYLLLHFWMKLNGNEPYAIRLLSVLFGTAAIPLIYWIGKRMSGVMVGLAASVFLACSPFNIRFAQETRMYTLLILNAAAAIYALVRLLTDANVARPIGSQFREYLRARRISEPPESDTAGDFSYNHQTRSYLGWITRISRKGWSAIQAMQTDLAWVAFILFSALTMLTHNTAVLFPLATNIFVLGLILSQRIKKPGSTPSFHAPSLSNWLKAQVGILLLWSPWISPFIQQARRVYQEFWLPEPGWETVIQAVKTFLNESTYGQQSNTHIIWILYALVLGLGCCITARKSLDSYCWQPCSPSPSWVNCL